ncbi:MAG: 6-hydroxymethylpterin diphosphokinase MptE-like protein [Haloarculaceae archaeon]
MNFETWEPVYEAILAEFGYDRAGDVRARDTLFELVGERETLDVETIGAGGATVAVAGAGPSLEAELDAIGSADLVFAASTAADRLREVGVTPDCVVTDLDKHPASVPSLSRDGVPVAVHAHGDNVPTVREVVPAIDTRRLFATTQAAPRPPVANVGGFTDGDRGAFLADHLGAARLRFPGWDFEDPSLGPEKRRKLAWAERLLHWLERRRGERFPVLDGRRADIDTAPLPV